VGANDVQSTSVNLWTYTILKKVEAEWSKKSSFHPLAGSATRPVTAANGHTVLVHVSHLVSQTRYFYRFVDPAHSNVASRVGTFTTAPKPTDDVSLTLAWSGDQDGTIDPATGKPCFNNFESFDAIPGNDPDLYLNLGDTIYADSECLKKPDSTSGFHLLTGHGKELSGGTTGQGGVFFSGAFGANRDPHVTTKDSAATVANLAFGDLNRDGYPDLVSGSTDTRLFGAAIYAGKRQEFQHLVSAWSSTRASTSRRSLAWWRTGCSSPRRRWPM
jgi:hypothetical protein